jgi:serine protease AprX
VSAAGNLGRTADGSEQYGGIGAPGNAPWVITVGASSHNGTADRSDDSVAAFSSRGPSAIDFQAKPDLVAPGVGIESLAEAGSTLYNTKPLMRLWGTVATATEPYLSLSGTSMASPVVSGTIALMLQANPALTPNQVKAVLQFTAERRDGYDGLTEGAGFLNARGAVELAESLAAGGTFDPAAPHADPTPWNGRIIWGNRAVEAGALTLDAWRTDVAWGMRAAVAASSQNDGENIVWGTECGGANCEHIVWGTACEDDECEGIVWGTASAGDTVVWGTSGDGEGEKIAWGVADAAEDVLWSAPAIRRPRRIVALADADGSLR